MWFDVEPVPIEFTRTSPFRIENAATIRVAPERLFDIWADGEAQETWFQDFRKSTWTSLAPRGVGATRVVDLATLSVKERFLVWQRGERMSFHIYAITLPLVSAMLEDLSFEPAAGGATRFVWRVHYRPKWFVRAAHPLLRASFGKMFSATIERLTRYAEAHPAAP